MRIDVERDQCMGNGYCTTAAPDVFDLDPDDGLVVLLVSDPDERHRSAVESAVQLCPVQALRASAQPS